MSKLLANFHTRFHFFDQIENFHLFGDRKVRAFAFEKIHDLLFTCLISMSDYNSFSTEWNEVISFLEGNVVMRILASS